MYMLDHRAPTNGEIKAVSTQQSQCSDYIYRGCDLHPVTMETSPAADVQPGCFCGWLIFKGRGDGAVISKQGHQVYKQPSGKIHFTPFDTL